MLLRFSDVNHFNTIPNGDTLQVVRNDDSDGQDRYLVGVRSQEGADLQRIRLTSGSWGNRALEMPPIGRNGAIAGIRTRFFPFLEFVQENQNVISEATQDSVGVEDISFDLIYIRGDLPEAMRQFVARQHTQFFNGTATNGAFPARTSATEQLRLNLKTGEWSPIEAAGLGTGAPLVRLAYPEDDGEGATIAAETDVYQDRPFQQIPALHAIAAANDVQMLGQDQSGSDISAWFHYVDIESGVPGAMVPWSAKA